MLAHRSCLADIIVALVTMVTEVQLTIDDAPPDRLWPVLMSVLGGAALLARRRFPVTVLAAAAGAEAVLAAAGDYPGGATVIVAMYTVADLRGRRFSLAALIPAAAFLQLASISSVPVTIGAWALGSYVQTRRRYTAALEERAANLERERRQLTEIAAQQERLSIARELHDIVAHSVTVVLLGVRGARDVLPTSPETARQTLGRVETTAEQAMAELRRVLTVLREPGHGAPPNRPPPSLTTLGELVDSYRAAGLPVRLTCTGQPRSLPDGIELSAYRIIEEALTNALKHASPATVSVTLAFGSAQLDVTIEDDGGTAGGTVNPARQGPVAAAGHGITGMRERAAALGGELTAGRRPDGGFGVVARLPIGEPG